MSWYAFFVKTGEEDVLCRYFCCMFRDCKEITYKLIIPKRELAEYKSGSKNLVHKPYCKINIEVKYADSATEFCHLTCLL